MRWEHSLDGGIQWLRVKQAQDVLHWAMRPASHRHIPMAVETAGDLHVFVLIADSLFAHNHS